MKKWRKQFDIRPHGHLALIIQSYWPGGSNVTPWFLGRQQVSSSIIIIIIDIFKNGLNSESYCKDHCSKGGIMTRKKKRIQNETVS